MPAKDAFNYVTIYSMLDTNNIDIIFLMPIHLSETSILHCGRFSALRIT